MHTRHCINKSLWCVSIETSSSVYFHLIHSLPFVCDKNRTFTVCTAQCISLYCIWKRHGFLDFKYASTKGLYIDKRPRCEWQYNTAVPLCRFFHKVISLYKVWLCNTNNSQAKPVNLWYHTQMHTQAKNNADVQPQYWCVFLYLSIEALSWLNLGMVKKTKQLWQDLKCTIF